MRICVFSREYSPCFDSAIEIIIDLVQKNNGTIMFYEHIKQIVENNFDLPKNTIFLKKDECISKNTDLLISLGGDGTLLETVNLVQDSNVPVMGVNFGRLGFLSNIQKEELNETLNLFSSGKCVISKRTVLQINNCNKYFNKNIYALNDISIHKSDSSSMISIKTKIGKSLLNNYWSDGLILSTPTGSTAYSLSCGGPIIVPEVENFVITPIAPHNLSVRPLVISDNSVITLIPEGRSESFILSLDSNQAIIQRGEEIVVSKAHFTVNFVFNPNDTFFSVIREKLMWGQDKRNT